MGVGGGGLAVQQRFISLMQQLAAGVGDIPRNAEGRPRLRVLPSGEGFKAGRLHESAEFWKAAVDAAGLAPWERRALLSVVEQGLNLMDFYAEPNPAELSAVGVVAGPNPRSHRAHERLIPRMRFPPRPLTPLPPHLGDARSVMREKIQELVATGAARECAKGEVPWVIAPIDLVVNSAGTKARLIHDLRGLNQFLEAPEFKFPSLRAWVKGVRKDALLVGVDWTSAYHAIKLTAESQLLCGFEWEGRLYVFCVLPFGLNLAPWLFQTFTDVFHALLRRHARLGSMGFVDDSAAAAHPEHGQSAEQRAETAIFVLVEASFLAGHAVSVAKSQLTPAPAMKHLGLWVHADTQSFSVPSDKLERFRALVRELLGSRLADVRQLQRLAGWLVAMTAAIPCALVFLRDLFAVVADGLRAGNRVVGVTGAAVREALRVLDDVSLWSGRFKWPSDSQLHVLCVATDASTTGVAGALCDASARYAHPILVRYARGLTEGESEAHIMVNEGRAVLEAVVEFQATLAGNHVRFLVDNTATQLALAGQGSRNLELNDIVKEVWRHLVRLAVVPTFDRVTTHDNVVADADSRAQLAPGQRWRRVSLAPKAHVLLSLEYPRFVPVWQRPAPESEMRLHPRLVAKALRWASAQVTLDLFATSSSAVVPRFVGLLKESVDGQVAVDAFSFRPGAEEFVFVNPPWQLIAATWRHLEAVGAKGVFVLPDDARALWYPMVLSGVARTATLAEPREARTFLSGGRELPAGSNAILLAEFNLCAPS